MEEDRREHIDIVTALRGVAALCVVLFHVRIFLWVGWHEINQNRGDYSSCDVFLSWFSVPTAIMGEFVLLFFIVSGFCIHYPNVGRCKEFRLKPYLLRRFVRIYPPYAIALIISMLVLFIAVRSEYTKSIMPSLLLIQNYYPLVNSQIKSNYSLWSIPTEIELYFIYAVFVSVYKFLGKGLLVLVVFVTLSLSIALLFNDPSRYLMSSLSFIFTWWSGAYLAHMFMNGWLNNFPRWLRYILFVVLFAVPTIYYFNPHNTLLNRLIFTILFFLLFWFCIASRTSATIFKSYIFRFCIGLGRISYTLYLLHYPFFMLCGHIWVNLFGSKPTSYLIPLVFVVLSVLLSRLFYKFIESPFYSISRRFAFVS